MKDLCTPCNLRSFRKNADKYFAKNLYTEEEKDIVIRTITHLMPGDSEEAIDRILRAEKEHIADVIINTTNTRIRDTRAIVKKVEDMAKQGAIDQETIVYILNSLEDKSGDVFNSLVWLNSHMSIGSKL